VLLQHRNDLLFREPCSLHQSVLRLGRTLTPLGGKTQWQVKRLPATERYINGVRRMVPDYPETAIREIIANALIHQDFTVTGIGPVVEIYDNRIEVTNAGNSLIGVDRMLDERRSRNEKLAATMRGLGLCEERGGGLDKTLIEIEQAHMPAPEFVSSETAMRVILFGPRPFNEMSKADKMRACFFHCVLRWLTRDYMSNASLRERFSLADEDYQAVSVIIAESIKAGRIAPADPAQGRRNARYVPYWAV
jgi:predicted HTH transcriptional regulator